MQPDPDQANWFLRLLAEIRNSPYDILLGAIALCTAALRWLGKRTKNRSPYITREQMELHVVDIINHVDTRIGRLETRLEEHILTEEQALKIVETVTETEPPP